MHRALSERQLPRKFGILNAELPRHLAAARDDELIDPLPPVDRVSALAMVTTAIPREFPAHP